MLFSKRRTVPPGTPLPHRPVFTAGTAVDPDGKPFDVRRNVALQDVVGHPDYPHRVGAIVLGHPLPRDLLRDVEDTLVAELEHDRSSVLALVMSSRSFHELVFYARSPTTAIHRGRAVADAFPDALLEVYSERDPDWSLYRDLVR